MYSYSSTGAAAAGGFFAMLGAMIFIPIILSIAISVVTIVSFWKIFKRAGKQGWEAIVPIYNFITLFQIVGINPLFVLGLVVPVFNIIIAIGAYLRLAQGHGKTGGYVAGLILLPVVFLPMLAFGKDSSWDASKIDLKTLDFLNDKNFKASPSEPTAQADPATAPATPEAPATSINPAEPATHVAPATPAPAQPIMPAEPVAPAETAQPVASAEPVASTEAQSVAPAETPAMPASEPATPVAPTEPATPETPTTPTTPEAPTPTA